MPTKKYTLTLETSLLELIDKKLKKQHYQNLQEYLMDLIRRDIFRKKSGGRPEEKTDISRVIGMKHIFSDKGKAYPI